MEEVKYYCADFFRQGGGVPPKSITPFLGIFEQKNVRKGVKDTPHVRNSLFAENFVCKGGGGTPLTDKIRKVVFEGLPYWYRYFSKVLIY